VVSVTATVLSLDHYTYPIVSFTIALSVRLQVQLAFGAIVGAVTPSIDAVLTAYGGRCAISHLPEPRLLDAAHIVMDGDEQSGQPISSNGLPLTKLHHAAFDAHPEWCRPRFPHPCV
jgi:hypothetical protein